MARVLIVDDERHIRDVIRFALQQAGHQVIEAVDGRAALVAFQEQRPELVVLDILMPELDGLDVCRQLRRQSDVPILFLSSRDDELDRVLGLELGGDDYVTKPFSPRELVARVKVLLRRLQRQGPEKAETPALPALRCGPLTMDTGRHECFWGSHPVVLTVTEFALLQALLRHPGRVYTREQLVQKAYGDEHFISDRTVDSHVRRIRRKLVEVGGVDPVETVYGMGYRLRDDL